MIVWMATVPRWSVPKPPHPPKTAAMRSMRDLAAFQQGPRAAIIPRESCARRRFDPSLVAESGRCCTPWVVCRTFFFPQLRAADLPAAAAQRLGLATYSALTTVSGAAAAEALGEALDRLEPAPGGVGVFEIEDGSGRWEVGGYFSSPPDIAGLAVLGVLHGAADFAVSRVEDRDWVAQVRRELHPVHAGRFTVHGAHDSHRVGDWNGPGRIGLRIEAAMAFGTGHHATTRGCLLLIDGLARRGLGRGARPRTVADIGCGTGVLAMAAARLWRGRCVATDIDEVAAATARENVRANRLGPWITTGRAAGFRHAALRAAAPFDLVCANILAAPLKRLAPEIARHLAPGGHVVLSGILRGQAAGVEAVFRGHGLRRARRVVLGDWVSLLLRQL